MRAAAATVVAALACGGGAGDRSEPAEVAGEVVKASYGNPFDLAIGERALVAGGLHVTFERVAEESRCPEGARCVQAGNAAAAFAVEGDAGSATLTLNTSREPRSAAAAGHELRLVELEPWPGVDAAIDTAAYAATLIVTPAP